MTLERSLVLKSVLVVEKGVRKKCEGMELPEREVIKEFDESGYKYVGVLEAEQLLESELKDKLRAEYFRRVRLLVRSKLYVGNVIRGMNS